MKLSIIVPIYKVEQYVHTCLESIFRQGLEEDIFEVILINDGTPDKSMEVIQDIIESHKNIRVINQENQGLSVARNNGIAAAKGEYILMPDSDDLLIENSLKPLLEIALETKADLVLADFLAMTDQEINSINAIPQKEIVIKEKTGKQLFLEDLNPYHCYVWRTLYKKDFIVSKNISFYPGIKYQDIPFTHECYLKAKNGVKTNILLNIYRRWSGSSTKTYNIKNTKDFIIAIAKTWDLRQMEGLSPDVLFKLEENIYTSFRMMIYHILHTAKQKTERNEIMDYLNHHAPNLYFTHGIQQRFISLMIKIAPHFFINQYYHYAQKAYNNNH